MLTGELRSQVDSIWNAFWSDGISNPMSLRVKLPLPTSGVALVSSTSVADVRRAANCACITSGQSIFGAD
ncbi:hypothetical protein [Variovorax sp. DXTD-1]|uniref:hypothetical protein n=1 Tax=Variovorax sp. DXTD-1 TaxID=2495592 RepID=UPI000F8743F7|nr:hypothetical protein [Variovorax sp. DXTD-1]RST47397.1 hypothetical protein EJI00_19200 [Variovorax sp. DXTD-1]